MNIEQLRLNIGYARQLGLFYQQIPSWDVITNLARPSKPQTNLKPPYWQLSPRYSKIQNLCIFR